MRVINRKLTYILISILLLSVVSTILQPSFLSFSNIIIVLRQTSILLILSLGLTGVVLTGNIDLSVGANAALTGCICAKLLVSGRPIAQAILLSLMVGIVTGLCNGLLVGLLKLPSFVATYGVNMVASGIATIVMNGGIIYDLPAGFTTLGIGYLGPLPIPVILAAIMYVIFLLVYQKTTLGRNIYMIGYNKLAADYSAVNSLAVLLIAYIFCGLTGSMGGIILTARLNAADAGMSEAYGLQIVAAVVVGGTSLLGGEGGVTGTVLGAMILTMIVNIMNMNRINSSWQSFVLGLIILVMAWINIRADRKRTA
ncbi:MAG: ABC transporter permease [Eubacterium sp.]|nr:ABC transporter permease [Eubacterium sp.]